MARVRFRRTPTAQEKRQARLIRAVPRQRRRVRADDDDEEWFDADPMFETGRHDVEVSDGERPEPQFTGILRSDGCKIFRVWDEKPEFGFNSPGLDTYDPDMFDYVAEPFGLDDYVYVEEEE